MMRAQFQSDDSDLNVLGYQIKYSLTDKLNFNLIQNIFTNKTCFRSKTTCRTVKLFRE